MMEFTQPAALWAQGIITLAGLAVGCYEGFRLLRGKAPWWPPGTSQIPRLPIPVVWIVLFLGVCMAPAFLLQNFFIFLLSILVLLLLTWRTGRSLTRLWGLARPEWLNAFGAAMRVYLGALLPLTLVTAAAFAVAAWFNLDVSPQGAVQMFIDAEGTGEVISLLVMAVLLAPLLEEIIFRGIFFPALAASWGRWPAILSTSLLFGASHFHVVSFPALTGLGILLCLVYDRTGKLSYPIALHIVFNGLTCLVILLERYGQ